MKMMLGFGFTAVAAMVAADPATVNSLNEELLKTLPSLKAVKDQMEGFIGGPVGAETIIMALFIVFCGRQVMTILDKAFDMWREERRATIAYRREQATADRAYAGAEAAAAASQPTLTAPGGLRAIRALSPHP